MTTVLYKSDPVRGEVWREIFAREAPELRFRIWPDFGDPAAVRYLVAWMPPPDLATAYTGLDVVFSAGAGVDQLDLAAIPAHLPVVRMVEPGIIGGMVEYVAMAVLMLHRDMPAYVAQQRRAEWKQVRVWPAATRRVGIMGLGVLGRAALAALAPFGFQLAGWSRSRQAIAGVECFAGPDERDAFLARTDILVALMPLTPETRGILDAGLFARLPRGAAIVNAGRGGHLVEPDLLAALDAGQLSAAILDVARTEPLPAADPLWRHPRIILTPHVASMTQPETAARQVLENIRRRRAGQPMTGLVDRARGY